MIDTVELMRKVGKIKILTSRLVDERLTGDYHSSFKGQGVEFDEVREYSVGDDVRSIDWNVTAKMGFPFIKRFCEERELTVMFLVDVSGSQGYGSLGNKTKGELAAELTCLLAMTSIRNQDNVGLILFSDKIEKMIPPRKGRNAVMRLVREVLAVDNPSGGTDIAGALDYFNKVQKRKCVVFLVSDFQDENWEQRLSVVARRHDVVCCKLSDPCEENIADVGLVELEDAETGEVVWLDTSSLQVRQMCSENFKKRDEELVKLFAKSNADMMFLSTDKDPIDGVRRFFKKRALRKNA